MSELTCPLETLSSLFEASMTYSVPPYQRAYSWDKRNIEQFLEDLREHPPAKTYYLGHYLFERKSGTELFVIDGQQRLSTVILLVGAACLILRTRGLEADAERLGGTYLEREGRYRFLTVRDDEALFMDLVGRGTSAIQPSTRSQERLYDAHARIRRVLEACQNEELLSWIAVLGRARVTQFVVESKVQATQIFTLQNSRGKDLTELEKLKALLMYQVYLHSSEEEDNAAIRRIEHQFEIIYRTLERIFLLNEDQVLRHHDHAYSKQPAGESPVTNLKRDISGLEGAAAVQRFITDYCTELAATFQHVERLEALLGQHDVVADLIIMDAPNTWPLLIKLYRESGESLVQNPTVKRILRTVEITLVKLHFQHGRTKNDLIDLAKQFGKNGQSLEWLDQRLQSISTHGFRWNADFGGALRSYFQGDYHYHKISRYMLWKYENEIRDRRDDQVSPGDYLNIYAGKEMDATIEHIEARKPQDGPHDEAFITRYLNNIGNLLFMPHGMNSSQGNRPPEEKASRLKNVSYASHRAVADQIATPCGEPECQDAWCEHKIAARKQRIVDFIIQRWNVS